MRLYAIVVSSLSSFVDWLMCVTRHWSRETLGAHRRSAPDQRLCGDRRPHPVTGAGNSTRMIPWPRETADPINALPLRIKFIGLLEDLCGEPSRSSFAA